MRYGSAALVATLMSALLINGRAESVQANDPVSDLQSQRSPRSVLFGKPVSHEITPAPSAGTSSGTSSSVEDLLLEKGSITMDDWIRIKAEEEYRLAEREKRSEVLEGWKSRVESLPLLTDKVNIGLNALQWQYYHQDAHVGEGQSQDNFFIRRSEILFWGRINDYIPRWHALYEFQSTNIVTNSSGRASSTFFRESYIDFRPFPWMAPTVNFFRFGIFRMPFGIFTNTSGGLRDVISSPYLTSVGVGSASRNGTAGAIEFLQERDFFMDVRGKIANRLEYVAGMMNGNNYHANAAQPLSANGPKQFYSQVRLFATDISWVSFNVIAGESNNTNTFINGRGKGEFDRWGLDFRYTSKFLPGFMVQGEWWQGHDGANSVTIGAPVSGNCQGAGCIGSGAPGVQRRTWYVLAKYLISDGLFENWEPTMMYEQFDPSTSTSNDLYTRTILGLTYYFENLPPKIHCKLQINYEFRHHQGNGPGLPVDPTPGIGDPFAQNAFLIQWQMRYM
jgi:hypothetical protein